MTSKDLRKWPYKYKINKWVFGLDTMRCSALFDKQLTQDNKIKQKFTNTNFSWNEDLRVDISCMNTHFLFRVQIWHGEKLIEKFWISLVDPFKFIRHHIGSMRGSNWNSLIMAYSNVIYGNRDTWVNTGYGNGMLPDGTKPSPEQTTITCGRCGRLPPSVF